jgi:hypothetical protein
MRLERCPVSDSMQQGSSGVPSDKLAQSAWTGAWDSPMRREDLTDLIAFLAVARERSFTKAAAMAKFASPLNTGESR